MSEDGWLTDDERDEDADGLNNFDESHGCMIDHGYWTALYDKETPYPVEYAGTRLDDEDTDGDGVRDGADDQDHDDMPNMMECSRNAASGRPYDRRGRRQRPRGTPAEGRSSTRSTRASRPCSPVRATGTRRWTSPWAPFNADDTTTSS